MSPRANGSLFQPTTPRLVRRNDLKDASKARCSSSSHSSGARSSITLKLHIQPHYNLGWSLTHPTATYPTGLVAMFPATDYTTPLLPLVTHWSSGGIRPSFLVSEWRLATLRPALHPTGASLARGKGKPE